MSEPQTLEEMAMAYVIVSHDISPDHLIGMLQKKLTLPANEWQAIALRTKMDLHFSPYQAQEAIKQAKEILRMILPEPAFVIAT